MTDCIFCKILRREIPSQIVFEDNETVAFTDVSPQAPTHILVIPRKHIGSLHDCSPEDERLLGHTLQVARDLAAAKGLHRSGYRIVLNTGADGGQTVLHLHLHLLGGRRMSWPPG